MDYRVEVLWKAELPDGRAEQLKSQVASLGIAHLERISLSDLYFLRGGINDSEVEFLCRRLLTDPVVQDYSWRRLDEVSPEPPADGLALEVGLRPGVTDSVADSLIRGAKTIGVPLHQAATARRYVFSGELTTAELEQIARGLLCNEIIHIYRLGYLKPAFAPPAEASGLVETVVLRGVSDEELQRLSAARLLSLSVEEMKAIRGYFATLGRDPADVELETIAQTWSEHCFHKTFRAAITYRGPDGETQRIDGLLQSYIRAATEQLARPWVLSAFVDNAGVIAFDDQYELSFKVETHNHPSALEPFGGANTGVGGVVRDIIGVSARPIANTDVLCFGPQNLPPEAVPQGVLHPRRISAGVIAGIEDYGNKMGIPTVNGAILYHPDYTGNPLVYCGCVGVAPRGSHPRQPLPGDLCVVIGGRTGRDGLHGATFSSAELQHDTGETAGSVVQIGNPIVEKAVLDAVLQARDEGLYHAITDCGAGGLASAAGEMGEEIGVEVDLSNVPLKYPGLRPWEVWLSEAQERMVLAIAPDKLDRLRAICEGRDVELTVIGHFSDDGQLRLRHGDNVVGEIAMAFLHGGPPRLHLQAEWRPPHFPEPVLNPQEDLTVTLKRLLASPGIAGQEAVVRRYDHEVQGGTVVKPFVGKESAGPSDAAVLKPLETVGWRGVAISCGINPFYGLMDPYAMAWAVVDEALRNAVAVGADPDRVALLDNFSWGNPSLPDRLGGLVRAAQGCYDAALCYRAPFISGKDSLNNEFVDAKGRKTPIPPTLLISALGIVPDIRRAATMDFKAPGSSVYVVGETRPELGGSAYYRLHGALGSSVPQPVPQSIETMRRLHQAMRVGLLAACHDCSEGGLGVSVAEMALASGLGADLDLRATPRSPDLDGDASLLFSESSGRFVVEVRTEKRRAFERLMAGLPCGCLGKTTDDGVLRLRGLNGQQIIQAGVEELKSAWQCS
jgi:phosphoribosylformylglycinamidine synthase II